MTLNEAVEMLFGERPEQLVLHAVAGYLRGSAGVHAKWWPSELAEVAGLVLDSSGYELREAILDVLEPKGFAIPLRLVPDDGEEVEETEQQAQAPDVQQQLARLEKKLDLLWRGMLNVACDTSRKHNEWAAFEYWEQLAEEMEKINGKRDRHTGLRH